MTPEEYNKKLVPIFAPDGFPELDIAPFIEKLNGEGFDYGSAAFTVEIKKLQKRLGIKVDGYCGPTTIEAIAKEHLARLRANNKIEEGYIVIGPKIYLINIPTVTYIDDFKIGDTTARVRKEIIYQVVLHHDVTFNAVTTEKILQGRGYSTHFIVDGDREGTIYQCHNPTTKVTFHAGVTNARSIGIDLNNPVELQYAKRDAQLRGRKRPIIKTKVHDREFEMLGYFESQYTSLNSLLQLIVDHIKIEERFPTGPEDRPFMRNNDVAYFSTIRNPISYRGIIGHYHITKRKIDPGTLEWDKLYFAHIGGKEECQLEKKKISNKKSRNFFRRILEMIKKIF